MSLTKDERDIAVELVNFRKRGIRWCHLEKKYGLEKKELKRIMCIYNGERNNEK